MSRLVSRSNRVLKGNEYNADSNGKRIKSDQQFKSFYKQPKGNDPVVIIKGTNLPPNWKPGQPIGVAL